ncbi:MAG TPA: zf-HC2 domain-containing protein [Bacteroidota bacterium]|nr:zf-HC2 domain-containing protein [Bacteroidota bacterium]
MEQNASLTCEQIIELIGHALDGELPKEHEAEFRRHVTVCSPCRNAYELETLAKNIVRSKLKRVPTPPHVYETVVRTLRVEQEVAPSSDSSSWWERILHRRFLFPALAMGVVAVVFLMFTPTNYSDQATRHTAANDIINQSIVNFALVRSGEIKPTMISCYPEGVIGFFERNGLRFAVNVKNIESCEWYGASSSEYNGVKLAHVVYKIGDDMMYVFQVSENDVQQGSLFQLPPAAREALAETNWYTDPEHPDCNVVLWRDKGTLCAAVSTMKKDRILALLTAK